jgi:hypothetical protein
MDGPPTGGSARVLTTGYRFASANRNILQSILIAEKSLDPKSRFMEHCLAECFAVDDDGVCLRI